MLIEAAGRRWLTISVHIEQKCDPPTEMCQYKATNRLGSTEDTLSHHKQKYKRLCTHRKGERHKRLPVSIGSAHRIYRKLVYWKEEGADGLKRRTEI